MYKNVIKDRICRSAILRPADIFLQLILNEQNVRLFTLLHGNPPRQNGMEHFMM